MSDFFAVPCLPPCYFPNPFKIDDIIEKVYANMSACHLKNENWQRALETANKVGANSIYYTNPRLLYYVVLNCQYFFIRL